jgi:hypothetical protein
MDLYIVNIIINFTAVPVNYFQIQQKNAKLGDY